LKPIEWSVSEKAKPQDRLGIAMDEAFTLWRRSTFSLLMLTLLVFDLSDLVPAMGVWRIVVGGVAALVLAGVIAAWIGLDRVLGRGTSELRSDRSTPPPFGLAHHSTTRWGTGPGQP
jgi:hypothetical protein